MNAEIQKINNYLGENFKKDRYCEMSKNDKGESLVSDEGEAYNFDDISDSYYDLRICSADAMLLKDNLYFIEFKRMSEEKHMEKIKRDIFLKMVESLHCLKTKILYPNNVDTRTFNICFILVIDSKKMPVTAMAVALAAVAQKLSNDELSKSFDKYRQKDKSNQTAFYDKITIVNEINFKAEISRLV